MAVKKHRPTSPRILQSRAEQVQNKDRQNKSKRIPQRIPCQWLVTQTQQKAQNWWQLVCLNNENDQWRASLSPSVPLSPVLSLSLSLCVSLYVRHSHMTRNYLDCWHCLYYSYADAEGGCFQRPIYARQTIVSLWCLHSDVTGERWMVSRVYRCKHFQPPNYGH